ncbi:MAG: type II secretion system F family protein [Fimbriimonas sp.]
MPTFEYQAQGSDGRVVSGVVFGVSLDHALRDLSSQGLQITQIGVAANINDPLAAVPAPRPAPPIPGGPMPGMPMQGMQTHPAGRPVERPREEVDTHLNPGDSPYATATSSALREHAPPVAQRSYVATSVWGPIVGKVNLSHLLFFFRQGATMFEAGVPIVQSLHTLAGQSQSPKLRGIIREMAGHVEAGRPISAALQRYPEVFSPVIVSLIRAGEEGGFLDEAMSTVADYLEREIELRNLYKRVTFMPKLQIVASIVIILGANVVIDYFGGKFKLWSPLSDPKTWIILTPIIVILFLFFRVGLANHGVKYVFDMVVSNIPYLGKTMRQLTMAKFGRAFGALYRGGVPMVRALQLSADACGNEYLRSRMYPAYKGLEAGRGITETFQSTGAFNPIVIDMVHTGETTGNLDRMLNKMSDYYEEEAATRAQKTGQVVGLMLALLVAIYIGYVVINFYMSYYGGIMKEA